MPWHHWFRSWPVVVLLAAAVIGVGMHLVADWYAYDPPNYTRLESGLWLGGYVMEPPRGCDAVLNVCELEDSFKAPSHRWQPIRDAGPAPALDWLRAQVDFIDAERAAGRGVFVHCQNGASRGPTVAAAYLMRREGWSRDHALAWLRERRPQVRPNPAFMALLAEWETSLGGQPGE